ncbi:MULTISPECIES: CidA/LrgA family protein [unclassified Stappia]|uniref:CidA/LrgA family protein n=1 Tax=unclassified Stappia TaxID=2629676 RepID=UPI0016439987|nr:MULTISPECIES: CidA/LrgA family protein [unclassified Stappia]
MIGALTLILCCQLAGELAVTASGLPVPGPVLGMILLFLLLAVRGGVGEDLGRVGDALLKNLALLFVPAGVGVVVHLGLIGREGLAITAALVVSTLLTVLVTGLVMSRLARREADGPSGPEAGAP